MLSILFIVIGIIWLIFASIQDLRTREVANWLSFSLIFIGLGARLIFGTTESDFSLFLNGVMSVLLMAVFAYALYYGRVFAGGDLKLMSGLGALIPGETINVVIVNCVIATIGLLLMGAIYSFLASIFVAFRRKEDFKIAFKNQKKLYLYIVPVVIVLWIFLHRVDLTGIFILAFVSFTILSYPYLKAVDKCMIRLYRPEELTEGDWLVSNVKIGKRTIKSSIHGLSDKDIKLIKKFGKKVKVKEGIPFVPAFLLTFIIMVFFFALKGQDYFAQLLAQIF